MEKPSGIVGFFIALFTAIIGNHIHHSFWWAIFDFIFWPISWIKWMICHDVNLSIIKSAFAFFIK